VRILVLGDVVGRPGRTFLKSHLDDIRKHLSADLVFANGENAAGGAGITAKTAEEIRKAGVDAITLGDHVWDQMNFDREIDQLDFVCRPANLPASNPGREHLILNCGGARVGLFTVLGRTFMGPKVACPFDTADRLIDQVKSETDAIVVEIHAETTSEKEAIGWFLDGRVNLVFGTHTHVPTADGRILKGGTAYQSDLGMTGPRDSVLGREIEPCIGRFVDGLPRKCPVAQGDVGTQGCILELDTDSGTTRSFERVEIREDELISATAE
jgi:2',3'-cyclic-nucleotide 2'-phosphodiesterase